MRWLVLTLLLCLPANTFAAIASDTTTTGTAVAATSMTYAYTAASTATIMIIGATYDTGANYTTITYNGATTTAFGGVVRPISGGSIAAFYTSSSLDGTAHNIVLTFGSSVTIHSQAATYTGSGSTIVQSTGTTCASNPCHTHTVTLTGNAANAWNVSWWANNETNLTASTNLTLRGTAAAQQIGDGNGVVTSSFSMTATTGGADATAWIGVIDGEIDPAAAAPAQDTNANWFLILMEKITPKAYAATGVEPVLSWWQRVWQFLTNLVRPTQNLAGATLETIIGSHAYEICPDGLGGSTTTSMTVSQYDALGLPNAPALAKGCVAVKAPLYNTADGFSASEFNPFSVSATSTPI